VAAALGHGIITSHPFVDGNKRTGGMAMLTFLALNGVAGNIAETAYYELVMETETGALTREQLAASLRDLAQ
jgi:death-on-curing protein